MIEVAGFRYQVEGQLPSSFDAFRVPDAGEADGEIRIIEKAFEDLDSLIGRGTHEELVVGRLKDGCWFYMLTKFPETAQLTATPDYRKLCLYLPPEQNGIAQWINTVLLLRTAIECKFGEKGILSLHSACIQKDGEAVAFTGRSGMGKSTRARAWHEALGAEWISGDRPAVDISGDSPAICGVPWDGKEQLFVNARYPLKAILEVRRGRETCVRRMTPAQARKLLMQQTLMPMWDNDAAFRVWGVVNRLSKRARIYRVFCGPDGQAAREVYAILYRYPEKIMKAGKDMRIRDGFVLRQVMGEPVVMPTGDNIGKFEGAAVLNGVSEFIFNKLRNPICREDLLRAILEEYDVDEEKAGKDLDAFLKKLKDLDILESEE